MDLIISNNVLILDEEDQLSRDSFLETLEGLTDKEKIGTAIRRAITVRDKP
jgi:hypothetical protein